MDAVDNPYSPGAGRRPAALVGRDAHITSWRQALTRYESARNAQPTVLYGLRGVGKTVLLAEFARLARQRNWIVSKTEAGQGHHLRSLIGEALHGPLSDLARPSAGTRVLRALKTALSFKASYDASGTWNFGVDLSGAGGGGADTGDLETDLRKMLRDVAAAAEEEGVGLALLIDEAQDLQRAELTSLCTVLHEAGQDEWSLHAALAGLPSLPRDLADAKSYAERLFDFHEISQLDSARTMTALVDPADAVGVTWDDAALDITAEATSGYPYFIQQFGQDTWNAAEGPVITPGDARLGAANARLSLDTGFFRARWDRATRSEQDYLRAMAIDGDRGSSSSTVAERMGRTPSSLGPARSNLISKGLVYAPEHGVIAFTVPGMAAFIERQPL